MQALQISKTDGYQARIVDVPAPTLQDDQVLVRVRYSSLNYKDALAITGRGRILRKFPLIAGIDLGGEVLDSGTSSLPRGAAVLATGCGLGEARDGGYCEVAAVPAPYLIPLPPGLSLRNALTIGTAGFTAALCLEQMELNTQTPQLGKIVITGASGGVGSIAIDIFSQRGYQVLAVSGKAASYDALRQFGAHELCSPQEFTASTAPLNSIKYGGAIDNLGGVYLAELLKATAPHGNIACVGLASSAELNSTVFPHILRGVNLLGISSNTCPHTQRQRLWQRLATDLKPRHLTSLCSGEITLTELPAQAKRMLERQTTGRFLVKI